MTKLVTAALIALAVPTVSSAASINLSAAFVKVNKDMNISANSIAGAGSNSMGNPVTADGPPCIGGGCGNPIGCTTSPENPTALLAVLGATGLVLGRFGYGRVTRRSTPVAAAA